MPPDSYSKFKSGDSVSTNDIVGRVGSYSSTSSNGFDPHLHFEILKGTKITDIKTGKTYYNYDTSLDPSKVVIEGGKIREKVIY
jgi:murein DD-endopeptidase MepM/ murein hydrolase activator NlpD